MADNTVLSSGSGGDTIATDDIAGVKHQRVKVQHGADGSATDVSTASPLPVGDAGGTLTVDAPVGTPVFVRLSDGAAAIATLPVSVSGVATAANQSTEITSLASLDGKTPALGQALAAASTPVVLTAAQVTTLTPPAAITGFATEATLDARTGSLTETAPATDTASSGLNGRLQRIAQRITSLITALGSPFQAGGSIGNTSFASTVADGADVTLGAKADAKSAATDITPITIVSILKQISAYLGATLGVTQSGTWTVQPGNTANTTAWKVDGSAVTHPVSLASVPSHAVTNAGTFATQAACAGDIAHDAADSGNPTKIGAKASTSLAGLTVVANADRSDLFCGVDGVQYVRQYCLEDVVQERTTNTDGASTAFASGLAAPGAGVRLWIKSVDICNSSASFCTVDLRDGAAGSVLWTLPVPATGGVVKTFDPPLKLTANTALAFDASAATTTLSISGNGWKSKV